MHSSTLLFELERVGQGFDMVRPVGAHVRVDTSNACVEAGQQERVVVGLKHTAPQTGRNKQPYQGVPVFTCTRQQLVMLQTSSLHD
jgi:hypothetical protein